MKNTYKKTNLAKIHNKISSRWPHSVHSSQTVMHHRAYDNATPTKHLYGRRSIKPNCLFAKYWLKSPPSSPPLISRDITIFAPKYMLCVVRHHYQASTQTSPYNKPSGLATRPYWKMLSQATENPQFSVFCSDRWPPSGGEVTLSL